MTINFMPEGDFNKTVDATIATAKGDGDLLTAVGVLTAALTTAIYRREDMTHEQASELNKVITGAWSVFVEESRREV